MEGVVVGTFADIIAVVAVILFAVLMLMLLMLFVCLLLLFVVVVVADLPQRLMQIVPLLVLSNVHVHVHGCDFKKGFDYFCIVRVGMCIFVCVCVNVRVSECVSV